MQSRYYDPELGRFINADSYASTGQGILGNNMFAYCRNNPVCRIDISGTEDTIAYGDGELLSNDELDERAKGGGSKTLPRQGPVEGNPKAPPVDAGKQGKHVPGHNNYIEGKSSWPVGTTGVQQTQEAWLNGVKDNSKPDQNVRIGVASDGTIVRVHMAGNGWIHGYPIGPEYICK